MSKIKQDKIPVTLDNDGTLRIGDVIAELHESLSQDPPNWKLVREHDGLTRKSKAVIWLEWDEKGKYKDRHDDPGVGRSLLMSPFNAFFTWQTTGVTEIVEQRDDYVKFHTGNSTYELFKIKQDE